MNNTTKTMLGLIVAILAVWGIYSISQKSNEPTTNEVIKIGVILPFTGDLPSLAEPSKIAVEKAIEEINNAGGINGRKMEAIFEDSKCLPAVAVSAVQKLININKVSVILGDICSSATLAVAPIVEKNKIPLISPCSSNPEITNAGDYIFRVYPSDSFQGKFAAEYIKNKLNYSKIAILYVNNDWGSGLAKVFKETSVKLGNNILIEESYIQGVKDLRTQITKIKLVNPEIIFFASYIDDAIIGLKQMKELNVESEILGGDSWADPKIANIAQQAAENIKWVEVKVLNAPDFLEEIMLEQRGKKDIPTCTLQSYDIIKLLAKVIKELKVVSGENIKNGLYQASVSGLSGEISFDKNGDLIGAEYVVKVIKDGKAEEIK